MIDKATVKNKVEDFVNDLFGALQDAEGKTGDIDPMSSFRLDELQNDLTELICCVVENAPKAETHESSEYKIRYTEVYSEVYSVNASSFEEGVKKLDADLREGAVEGPRYCTESSYEEV